MAAHKSQTVTMRAKVGDAELEVSGPPDFVEAKIAAFLDQQKQQRPASPPPTSPTAPSQTAHRPPSTSKSISAAQFFQKLSPKNDVQRVLAAGYFLEKYGGADNFITSEIVDVIRQAKRKPPSNPSESVSQNIKKGHLMPAGDKDGKRAFVLTSDGEEAVANSLTLVS